MKLLYGVPGAQGALSFFLPTGQYGNFLVRYTGTAAAGVTVNRLNLGNVNLVWNGQDVINVDAEILNLLDNVYGGVAEATSAIGAAFAFSIFIPCGQWVDAQNVYDVGENDKVSFRLNFPDLANVAIVAAAQINIYAKEKVGVMNYLSNLISRFVVAGGAGPLADTYPVSNVSQIYLKNPAAVISDIQILKDGATIVDCPIAVVSAYSDWIHLLETAGTTMVVEFGESKDVRENVGSKVSYKYVFTGAGTLSQYFNYITFTAAKALESRAKAAVKLAQNVNAAQLPKM